MPLEGGRVFITSETIHPPVTLGLGRASLKEGGARAKGRMIHSLYVAGGVPADKGGTGVQPLLGVPHIDPGTAVTLRFALRFAPPERPASQVLRPYRETFRAAQAPHLDWPDRRPIGRIEIPSRPEFATMKNPRGWFRNPKMDVSTPEGRQQLRQHMETLAEQCLARMTTASAQGMVVWNIEGGNIYPDQPLGDPRHLAEIAPEMNAIADDFFQRFRDAGYRTGVCIRPTDLHYSGTRQRWTQGPGSYNPEHEDLPNARKGVPDYEPNERVYPLAERMAAKIQYAKDRWGCTLFFIEYNGAWHRMSPYWSEDWLLLEARVLQRVREMHPDVLLMPAYAERYWRTCEIGHLRNVREQSSKRGAVAKLHESGVDMPLPPLRKRVSLRGIDESRLGGAPTPEYPLANKQELERMLRGRYYPQEPWHIVRDAYWATAAPYVKLRQWRLHKEYILTLEQHMEYSAAEAEEMASSQIAFETTPAHIRGWMPEAVTVIDTTGADVQRRRSQIVRAAAWGDVLMWTANQDPAPLLALSEPSQALQKRVTTAAAHLGITDWQDGDPLMPVSIVWQKGTPLDTQDLVAGGGAPDELRARVAYSGDRSKALVMLAWPTGGGEILRINAALPGVDIAAENRRVWDLETGTMMPRGESFQVKPDPLARFNVLLVDVSAGAPPAPPDGVVLGVSFDQAARPDVGGGMPRLAAAPASRPKPMAASFQLAGNPMQYNIVPSWFEGTLEFDIAAKKPADNLHILSLKHHMDLELRLAQRNGKSGIVMKARDLKLGSADALERETFIPLSGQGARHIVLTWEIGQYRLFVEGALKGKILGPTELARRDGTTMVPGLAIGDAQSGGDVTMDSLIVYDWSFEPEQAKKRRAGQGVNPLPRQQPERLVAWAWGTFPEKVSVGINARPDPDYPHVKSFRVGLYERVKAGQQFLGSADLHTFGGVAAGPLSFNPKGAIRSGSDGPKVDFDAGPTGGPDIGGELDFLAEDLAMETGKNYVLEIVPHPEDAGMRPRTVEFEAGPAGPPDPRLR